MKHLGLLFFTALLFASCVDPCYEVKGGLGSDGVNISLFHRGYNEYFYPEDTFHASFNKDSLRVTTSDGRTLQPYFSLQQDRVDPLKRYYVVYINPIFNVQTDQDAFTQEKTTYVYLSYNYNTADTLKIIFKAKKTECVDVYEHLQAFYRDTLLASISNYDFLQLTLKH